MNPDENAQQRGRRTNFTQSLPLHLMRMMHICSAAVLVRTENWPPRIRDGVVRHECHVPIRCGVHIFEKCNPLFALITCAVTWIWSNRGGKIASKDWDNKYNVTIFLHSCTLVVKFATIHWHKKTASVKTEEATVFSEPNADKWGLLGPKLLLVMGCVKLGEKNCFQLASVGEQNAN